MNNFNTQYARTREPCGAASALVVWRLSNDLPTERIHFLATFFNFFCYKFHRRVLVLVVRYSPLNDILFRFHKDVKYNDLRQSVQRVAYFCLRPTQPLLETRTWITCQDKFATQQSLSSGNASQRGNGDAILSRDQWLIVARLAAAAADGAAVTDDDANMLTDDWRKWGKRTNRTGGAPVVRAVSMNLGQFYILQQPYAGRQNRFPANSHNQTCLRFRTIPFHATNQNIEY